jgi:hypothetical protein
MIRRALLLGDKYLKILPVGEVDAAGEAPAAVEREAAIDAAAGAAFERERRGAQRVGVRPLDVSWAAG